MFCHLRVTKRVNFGVLPAQGTLVFVRVFEFFPYFFLSELILLVYCVLIMRHKKKKKGA